MSSVPSAEEVLLRGAERGYSIRARLLLGAALVLIAFMALAGLAVQRAHGDSVRTAYFSRLQGTVYLLLARAELDGAGALIMPPGFAEPRLSLPGSGLYAAIHNPARKEVWRSGSTLGRELPLPEEPLAPGEWRTGVVEDTSGNYLSVRYGVNWTIGARNAPLWITVLEDRSAFDREVGAFARTSWMWLGGAGALLLLTQLLLLKWGLAPLRRVAEEIREVEAGGRERIAGRYPVEISGLVDNLNTLIQQERVRQGRYREALSFLAHSLKTPLAVLRSALGNPQALEATVADQVRRMDDIVQHQLARAAAQGAARFATRVDVAPLLTRVRDALLKVHADKGIRFEVHCPPDLGWRMDEGDLFEIVGNLMDNAGKWARSEVVARAFQTGDALVVSVEDDGPGFADTESILKMHVRLDERVPGHGVGLAVVNDIVASHHGTLALGRSQLGGGSARVEIRTRERPLSPA